MRVIGPGPGVEQGGELVGLVVGEDAAAGGRGEAVERIARGGQLDALRGVARQDVAARPRGSGCPVTAVEVERPRPVAARRAGRRTAPSGERGCRALERSGLARHGAEWYHGDGLARGLARPGVGLEDPRGDQQVGADARRRPR